MRSAKKISMLIAALVAYATVFGQSGDFQTAGIVKFNGQPLQMATVTYTSVAQRLSWDFSRSDGSFGGPTSTLPQMRDQRITLPADGPVTIDIFDVGGKKITTVNGKLDKGSYLLQPFSAKLAQTMYVLKIKAGDVVTYQKMMATGNARNGIAIAVSSSNAPTVLAKKMAYIDTVRVGKTGFTPVFIPITTYADNVGTVNLDSIDIEGLVNTVFGQMTPAQKYGICAMPAFQNDNAAQCAADFCGLTFGGGGCFQNSANASDVANTVDSYQSAAMGTTLKIPMLFGYDAVHGASAVPGVTLFPHNLGMGAIQDTLLIQKAFRVGALEVRGSGANFGFGPCIAVIRDDRWGRAYEGFCETPERTKIMANNAVLGLQTSDLSLPRAYAACAKHFAGDGNTVNGSNGGTTQGPDSAARAINLPGYVAAVNAGVATIMPSFSSWCAGVIPSTIMSKETPLLTNWLKLGQAPPYPPNPPNPPFKGFLVSDWDAVGTLDFLNAGGDVLMSPEYGLGVINDFTTYYGTIQARVTDAMKRVLRVKAWMGMLSYYQNQKTPAYLTDRSLTTVVYSQAHRDVARACVRASLVLLKNNSVGGTPVLPIPATANVAIWGVAGDNVGIQCGGWAVSWQGQVGGIPGGAGTSIRTGIQSICSNVSYTASPASAGTSDYVIAFLSENPYAETDFPDISLTDKDASSSNSAVIAQIAAAHTAGKKVIGVLLAGRVLDISTVLPNCDAFVWASLPGTEGLGVGEMLFGVNGYKFTGKLPVTWPQNLAQEPINVGDGKTGLFAYGYGLTD
jgi:beta-glucosidase